MRDKIGLFIYHHATLNFAAVVCMHISEYVLVICVVCV